jgi:succinoglycan biosynthesis transport protein ExoP
VPKVTSPSKFRLTPLSLIRAVTKHPFLVSAVACSVASAGVALTLRLPSVYKAEALVLVDPQKVPEKFVASTVSEDVQDRLATISQEILSNTRLKDIIDDFHLYENQRAHHVLDDVLDMMRKDIEIRLEKGVGGNRPGAFRIIYQGSDPKVVAEVVNRITKLYITENYRSRESQAEGTSTFIQRQLDDARKELDTEEQAFSRYKLEHNLELPAQENGLIASMTRLQIELQGNQDATNRAQQEKLALEGSISAAEAAEISLQQGLKPGGSVSGSLGITDPSTSRLRESLQRELARLRLRYSDDHPDVKSLRKELAQARAREIAEAQGLAVSTADAIAENVGNQVPPALTAEQIRTHERLLALRVQLDAVVREIPLRLTEHGRIVSDLEAYQRRIEQLPVREQEMAALTRNYEFAKTVYRSLLDKKYAAEMATDLEKRQKAETFRVIDAAKTPQKAFKPKREVLFAGSILGALLLGILCAIGLELRSGVLLGGWELPPNTVILCEVPQSTVCASWAVDPNPPDSNVDERQHTWRRSLIFSSAVLSLLAVIVSYIVLQRL